MQISVNMHEITDLVDSAVPAFFLAVLGTSFEDAQFHTSTVKIIIVFDNAMMINPLVTFFCRFCSASNGPSNSFSKEVSRAIILSLYSL